MGSKWYRFINGVSFTEDDVAMFVVSDFLCVICFVAATACFYQMYTGKDLFR